MIRSFFCIFSSIFFIDRIPNNDSWHAISYKNKKETCVHGRPRQKKKFGIRKMIACAKSCLRMVYFCVINNASNRKRFMNKHVRIKRYQSKRSCFRLCIIWKNWSLFYIEHSKQSNLESCFRLYDRETKMTFVHTRVIDNNTVIGIKCSYSVSNARFMDIMYDLYADV